ncbi:MAG TPA: hypothetical protein VND91_11305 [Candidatus Saccharimonadia bacterium]|nr:hypothetical protein [Candidatus Saccharimonadia bacterium]
MRLMQYRVAEQPATGSGESWFVCIGDSILARFTSRSAACAAAKSLAILDCVSGRSAEVIVIGSAAPPALYWVCPGETGDR